MNGTTTGSRRIRPQTRTTEVHRTHREPIRRAVGQTRHHQIRAVPDTDPANADTGASDDNDFSTRYPVIGVPPVSPGAVYDTVASVAPGPATPATPVGGPAAADCVGVIGAGVGVGAGACAVRASTRNRYPLVEANPATVYPDAGDPVLRSPPTTDHHQH